MQVFGNYARYYNLFYGDKDYASEAKFVHYLIQKYASQTQKILELGCGTGKHASLLADWDYRVCGIDFSEQMLEQARQELAKFPADKVAKLEFHLGDIRSIRLERQFDAVISLFHVFSYQTANQDLQAAFATAAAHLKPGGKLIFDCWYGPAVLSDRPAVRIKRLKNAEIAITRIAEPEMDAANNLVDVNYQVFIKDLATSAVEELAETHKMRYLFKPEVELFLASSGMELIDCGEWLNDKPLSDRAWNAYFVAQKLEQST